MKEILSIAAYLPFSVLPESVTEEIISEIRKGFFLKDFSFSDENTELYFLKAQGSCCDYEVTATMVYNENEPPETEIIYLAALCEDERKEVDSLIIERIQYALQHISEI